MAGTEGKRDSKWSEEALHAQYLLKQLLQLSYHLLPPSLLPHPLPE